jgi:membrane-bound lytic murein transglycosylase MltF
MIDRTKKSSYLLITLFLAWWAGYALWVAHRQYLIRQAYFNEICERKLFRVCGDWDPFSYYTDENGSHGFHYELAKAFAAKHQLKLYYFYEPNFRQRIRLVQQGRCDMIAGPLPVTLELQKHLDFTLPL